MTQCHASDVRPLSSSVPPTLRDPGGLPEAEWAQKLLLWISDLMNGGPCPCPRLESDRDHGVMMLRGLASNRLNRSMLGRLTAKSLTVSTLVWSSLAAAQGSGTATTVGAEPQRLHEAAGPRLQAGEMLGFMGWGVNVPVGSVRAFVADPSLLGLEAQFRAWLLSRLSLGVSGEWATFVDQRSRETVAIDSMTITAPASTDIQTLTTRFLVHYYLFDAGRVLPYVGPHLGIGWSVFDVEAARRTVSDSETSLVLGVEGGVVLPLGEGAPVMLAHLRYSYLPTAEFQRTVDDVRTVGMLVGVGF